MKRVNLDSSPESASGASSSDSLKSAPGIYHTPDAGSSNAAGFRRPGDAPRVVSTLGGSDRGNGEGVPFPRQWERRWRFENG